MDKPQRIKKDSPSKFFAVVESETLYLRQPLSHGTAPSLNHILKELLIPSKIH